MKHRIVRAGTLCVFLTAPGLSAQESTVLSLAVYYRCEQAKEQRADAIFEETIAPLLAKQVEAGSLSGFGWLRHWMGGEWRRHQYVLGTDLDAMVDARTATIAALQGEHKAAIDEFASICSSHDDYLWSVVSTSPPAAAADRYPIGLSTYFQCGSDEAEADAIFESHFGPVMNRHLEEGQIGSWSWLRHELGGEYRRVLVVGAASHAAAIGYWRGLAPALAEASPQLSRRFTEICPSHTDYIWDPPGN